MINNGLLEEVESLKDMYESSRVLKSAIGYKEFYDYFYQDKSLEKVIEEIQYHSRKYAKRQYTFFNHQFETNWFSVDFDCFQNTVDAVYNFLKKEAN